MLEGCCADAYYAKEWESGGSRIRQVGTWCPNEPADEERGWLKCLARTHREIQGPYGCSFIRQMIRATPVSHMTTDEVAREPYTVP